MHAIVNDVTRTVAGSLTTALDRLYPALVRLLAGLDQAQSALTGCTRLACALWCSRY